MSSADPTSFDRRWRAWTLGLVFTFVAAMSLLGFVILPIIQGRSAGLDAFTAICRALGVQAGSPVARQPVSAMKASPVSSVAWTPAIIDRLRRPNKENGARLAANVCAPCHGADGISTDPQFPHLAGQSAYAIYKQLHDYKNGARESELMASVVKDFSDDEMADVSDYFAALTKGALDPAIQQTDDAETRRLVEYGYTERRLPACASCHGAHAGGPVDTPTISGQRPEYLTGQMAAFAKGERHNDIFARMREIAANLRQEEIAKLADYYGGRRTPRSW